MIGRIGMDRWELTCTIDFQLTVYLCQQTIINLSLKNVESK